MRHKPRKKIYDVYGLNAVLVNVAQNCFKRFQSGHFDVKDELLSGRRLTDKVDTILDKVEQDRYISFHKLVEELGLQHKTVLTDLKKSGYIKQLDNWIPHEITERNVMNSDSHLRFAIET
ncbi:Histone-lysine N-methyltransferase SETMAR [Eumeta japonica]|uniref:Histone-lysine N-methyltransferase SETMAR n=1 Tax=Eumeta variegata TaxID=151549 RepID=A0A4C1UPN9_EUMVA|nr:Histone-lysine N-methyltransferase SETMAR [Eumeta japonica]